MQANEEMLTESTHYGSYLSKEQRQRRAYEEEERNGRNNEIKQVKARLRV